jgi:hypothetical protein
VGAGFCLLVVVAAGDAVQGRVGYQPEGGLDTFLEGADREACTPL